MEGAAAVAGVGATGEAGATGGVPGAETGVPGAEAGAARGESGFAGGSLWGSVGNGTSAAKSSCLSPHFGHTKVRDLIASRLRSSGGQSRAPIAPWPSVGIKATRAVIIVRMSQLGCQCSG